MPFPMSKMINEIIKRSDLAGSMPGTPSQVQRLACRCGFSRTDSETAASCLPQEQKSGQFRANSQAGDSLREPYLQATPYRNYDRYRHVHKTEDDLLFMSRRSAQNLPRLAGNILLLICLIACPQVTAQQTEERISESDWEGLKALYVATGGNSWTNNASWDIHLESPAPENLAGWHGITVMNGRVTELDLSENGLTGTLPVELGNLSALRILDLQGNELFGPIGPWIGNLASLRRLRLQKNLLSGTIPAELGNLIQLEYLNLRGNRLEGSVPQGLGRLRNLRGIWLHANQLSGSLPQEITELPNLEWLWLGENPNLFGVILVTDSRQATSINFYLDESALCIDRVNAVPDENFEPNLEVLEHACLPAEEWDALETLYQSTRGADWIDQAGWNFAHRLKAETVGLWHGISVEDGHVRTLRLERNHLDGNLSPEIGSLTRLEVLSIDGNPLQGAIPDELSSLQALQIFSASDTQLCIPDTAAVQLWLESIPTVLGIGTCENRQVTPSVMSSNISRERPGRLPDWLVISFGLLGVGTVLFMLFTRIKQSGESRDRPSESSPHADRLHAIEKQLDTVLANLGHDENTAKLISILESLHRLLNDRDQRVKTTREPEETPAKADPHSSSLKPIEERLDILLHALDSIANLSQQPQSQRSDTEEFMSALKSLRSTLSEREQEVKRLKQGHDNAVFRKFVTRFVRVDQAVQYFIKNTNTEESISHLESIHSLLEDALLECDVQPFTPETGSDYRYAFGVSDHPKILPTTTREDDCKIAEILEPGYVMQGGREREILIPARVAIYRFKPEE